MRIKISHYVAQVDGRPVYETSQTIHADSAWLCRAFSDGGYLTQYINPLNDALNGISEGKHLRLYPATRFMTEKKQEFLQAQFTGGVEE